MTRFQDLEEFTAVDIEAAFARNDPDELRLVPISVALISLDPSIAQDVCIRLSSHVDAIVRGNAIMSLGHLARRFRELNESTVKPVIESGLADTDQYVREHAKAAADEIHQFLHWTIAGHVYG